MKTPNIIQSEVTRGTIAAAIAFFLWGILPLFWMLFGGTPPLEIVCHRVVWSFFFIVLLLTFTQQLRPTLTLLRNSKSVLTLALSGFLLAGNWLLYVFAIQSGKVLETSLGYYINPLISILVGIFFFKDRASRLVWLAIALAVIGVLYQVVVIGYIPFIAFGLACSFALYGILRKIVAVEALPGLLIETTLCFPFAALFLGWRFLQGTGTFGTNLNTDLLLLFAGIATTIPLAGFAYGARRIRLTTIGILQYIGPSLTFLIGIFVFKEPFTQGNIITFGCIWAALALYTYDSLRLTRTIKKNSLFSR